MLKKLGTIVSYLLFSFVLLMAIALVGMMLPFVPYQIRIVESGSMEPTVPTGAIIFISPAANYTVGDVVTFQRSGEDEVTTHRIVEERLDAGKEVFVTQGDANDVADMNPVFPEEISGKMWAHIAYMGYLLNFFSQPVGFLILIVIPVTLILIEQVRKIRDELRRGKVKHNDTNDDTQNV